MKKVLILAGLLCFVAFSIYSENTLDYLEGYLEVQKTSGWDELDMGDAIPSSALLRLSDNGYAEILVSDAVVTLIKDGNYNMQELVSSVSGISSSSMDLKKKLTFDTEFERWQQEATMGVRGAEQTAGNENFGMEDAYTYLNAGLELLMEEDYNSALANFEEGWEFFEDDNCLFFSAVCYDALGQKRAYVQNLRNVTGSALDEEFIASYTIRMSDLLLSSLAYGDAVELLESLSMGNGDFTSEEMQNVRFLLGRGYLGLDQKQQAVKEFNAARDMDPSSEVGQSAADALSSL
jgi:tetratricopeptide (TPR) repeat protein